MFHSRDGLFFTRSDATDVVIIKTTDGKSPWTRSTNVANEFETNIAWQIRLPENEWASVVCSVSVLGETAERWNAHRAFHAATK